MYKYLPFILILSIQTSFAQLCEGSLGDPVAEIDFGSGVNRGDALGASITAFEYRASGELDEGEYTIVNSTSGLKSNAWHVTNDHTGNTNGYMMVINSAVLADEGVFYTKTVSGLCGYTTYEFSAWLMNVMNPSVGTDEYHPNVTFRISDISGNILGSYNTGDIQQTSSGTWVQYGFFFTLDIDTEVVIRILNSAPSAHPGNDIALDDITFKPCGPTIINAIENETTTNLTLCQNEVVRYNFQASISSGYSNPQYQWQVSDNYGATWIDIIGENSSNYAYSNTSESGRFLFRATVANGDNINTTACRITSDEFSVEVIETPEALFGESEQSFCTTQNPTLNDIEVSTSAIWYDALNNGNKLSNALSLIDGTTYYAAQETSIGCESDERLAVLVSIVTPTLMTHDITTEVCDNLNDSNETVNLTDYELILTSCTDCSFSYYTSLSDSENDLEATKIITPTSFNIDLETTIIYVRIDSPDYCYQTAKISFNLMETPILPIPDILGICESARSIIIDAGFGFESYLWSTGATTQTITVPYEAIGNYSITVTQEHEDYYCASTKDFKIVPSNTAIISNIDINDWTDNENSMTVNLSELSLGDYEYSLDDITYQESNIFTNLNYGEQIVYIRDKNGCGTISKSVYFLNAPKFFTPNADGYNDTWFIKNSEIAEPSVTIKIYDRYGKLLKFLDASSSWDGTSHGNNMPTSDYWFVVTRANGQNQTGHFTLKR